MQAKKEIGASDGRLKGEGMATAGIVIGIIAVIGFIISIVCLVAPLRTTGRPGGAPGRRLAAPGGRRGPLRARSPNVALRADLTGHPAAERGEALVVLAREDEDRHAEAGELVPPRHLAAGAGQAEAAGQAVDGVPPPIVEVGGVRRQVGEQGLGQPALEERIEPVALQLARPDLVRAAAGGPLGLVLDPGGRAEEHQGVDLVRPVQGQVQRQPAAHRVADIGGPATGGAEQRRARRQVGPDGRRAAVARCVHQHDLVVAAEVGGDRAPRAPGLGEAVDEHDPRTSPLPLDVEGGHAGSDAAASSSATRSSTRRNVSGSCAPGTDHRRSKT